MHFRTMPVPHVSGRYSYFTGLLKNNIPKPGSKSDCHEIISWYSLWKGRAPEISVIYHSVKGVETLEKDGISVEYIDNPILPLFRTKALLKFICWAIAVVFSSVFNFITGRWWNVLLLQESMLAAKVRLQDSDLLAKEYLFHNSGWIYRPLWTYEAESKGSRIQFYFYSTNCEGLGIHGNPARFLYGYQAMNWPNYMVWDTYQSDFIKRAVGNSARVEIVGPISFSASSATLPVIPEKSIAVFDVQPMRDAFYKILGLDFEYYVPSNCNRFLSDIYSGCEKSGYTMVLKRKREVGKNEHPSYRNMVRKISALPCFLAVDPGVSADKLIDNVFAVISMPFTSTALLGRNAGKPSVYYDPLKMLQKNDPGAHGIEILQTSGELDKWLTEIFSNQN